MGGVRSQSRNIIAMQDAYKAEEGEGLNMENGGEEQVERLNCCSH